MARLSRLASAAYLVALAGCQQPPAENALPVTETSRDFGDYIVHFNALTTDQLTAEIAQRHGIIRSNSRCLLNVSILRKEPGGASLPVKADVNVSASNLTGQLKNVSVREIQEQDAVYYLGECSVANAETLIFDIDVTPENEESPLSVRYRKQFFLN